MRYIGSFPLPLLTVIASILLGNVFLFLSILTPAWQVAEDTDARRYVQSGLWLYCPGAAQCWYIFSDDLINYYEKVDVCRFFLIADCRKKLLRTPYFFGWHYAVLILLLCTLACTTAAIVAALVAHFKKSPLKAATIVLMTTLSFGVILYMIGLAVFMINAEMLESRFLIGVTNVFEKSYGYSFFLACLGCMCILFSLLAAIYNTTVVFFGRKDEADGNDAMHAEQFGMLDHRCVPQQEMFSAQPLQPLPYAHGSDKYYGGSQYGGSITTFNTLPPGQGEFQQTTRTFLSY